MFTEFLITFREALEAALAIGIIMAYLQRTGNLRHAGSVYVGVLTALVASVFTAVAFNALFGGFEGAAENIFEGSLMVFASLLVTWMVFWMMKQGRLREDIENKTAVALSRNAAVGLSIFAFISVFREGVETVIFISAAAVQEGGNTLFGVAAGLSAAILLSLIVFKTAARLNLKMFFKITSIVLILFAAGILVHGVHEFQEAGWLPAQDSIWNTTNILDDEGTLGGIMRTLVGYNDSPTSLEAASWLGYLVLVMTAYNRLQAAPK
ncbi:MAG: FTR1 family protein [Candidatus Altiarchaeota archaeon]|nr:FTR1 family protein [Candidatus Altiarchaeota archaeon]